MYPIIRTQLHTLYLAHGVPSCSSVSKPHYAENHQCAASRYAAVNGWLKSLPADCSQIVVDSERRLHTDTGESQLVLPYLDDKYTVFASRLSHCSTSALVQDALLECARASDAAPLLPWTLDLVEAVRLRHHIYLSRHPLTGTWYGWIREGSGFPTLG